MTKSSSTQRSENEKALDAVESSTPEDSSSSEKSLLTFIREWPRRETPEHPEETAVHSACAPVPSPDKLDEFADNDDSRAAIRLGGNGF